MKGSLLNFNKNANSDHMDVLVFMKLVFLFIFSLFSGAVLTQRIDNNKVAKCFDNPVLRMLYLLILTSSLFDFTLSKPYNHVSEMIITSIILFFIIQYLEKKFPSTD